MNTRSPYAVKRFRALARNVVVGASSLLLVVGAMAYLATPPGAAFAIRVGAGSDAHGRHGVVVLYGKATALDGSAISDLRIVVSRIGRPGSVVATIDTGRDGTYREDVPISDGPYRLSISERSRRRFDSASRTVVLKRGRAYRIDVTVKRHGGFWFVPVTSY